MAYNPKKRATNTKPQPDSVEARAAKGIADVIADSLKMFPKEEQDRRINAFCDALDGFLRNPSSASVSRRSE